METQDVDSGLAKALERAKPTEIGKALGITSQAVGQWKRVPPTRVLDVERLTGVPRHELRPDLYPSESTQ